MGLRGQRDIWAIYGLKIYQWSSHMPFQWSSSERLIGVWLAILLKLKMLGRRLSRSPDGSRVSVFEQGCKAVRLAVGL